MEKDFKVCFIALGAYPLLTGKDAKRIVGPDVHQFIIANELLNHGVKISVITYKKGKSSIEYSNGIEVITLDDKESSFKILTVFARVVGLWQSMMKSKADIYYNAGGVVGVISFFSKLIDKRFVYEVASDALINRDIIFKKNREFNKSEFSLDVLGTWMDVKLANKVIVQSEYQQKMLSKNFSRKGTLIKMPFRLPEDNLLVKENPPIVLWVGSMAEVKQPELFIKLAIELKNIRFQMIGGPSGDPKRYEKIKKMSDQITNLEFLGTVPFSCIDAFFRRSSILVNTSMFEGFPNAFIQAWMHYMPVVSLNADPDEVICTKKLGFHSKTFDQLVRDVKILIEDKKLLIELGKNCRQYVEKEHDITKSIDIYLRILDEVRTRR